MDSQRKIVLFAWIAAAILVIALIVMTRSGHGSGQKLSSAIIGTWQGVGMDEQDEFRNDGTVVVQGQNKRGVLKYGILDPHRLQFAFEGQPPRIYNDVSVEGDELTMTNTSLKAVVHYRRVVSEADRKLPPAAKLDSPQPLPSDQPRHIDKPGVAPKSVKAREEPRPTPFAVVTDGAGVTQKANELKKAIIGKWESLDKMEINEWTDEQTLIITDEEGKKIQCAYKVTGQHSVTAMPEGTTFASAPLFTIFIDGDTMTLTRSGKDGPVTDYFLRLNAKGEMPTSFFMPVPIDEAPPIKAADILGNWTSDGQLLSLAQDGTYTFDQNKGRWEIQDGVLIVRDSNAGTVWKLTISADGKKIFGYWSRHQGQADRTGILMGTR